MIDIRDAFFDEIYEIASKDKNIVLITNDMDIYSLRQFKEKYPDRFINIGVAEQNMVNVAAGLASCGKKVIIYGISSFLVYRCFEQIKFNICSMNLPVIFAGVGSGLAFSFDGPTHHGTHDIDVLASLPEMEIFNPGETFSAKLCAKLAVESEKPTFVRLDKGPFPELSSEKNIIDNCFSILKPVKKVNIISTGSMTSRAMKVSEVLENKGNEVGVVDLFRIKTISNEFIKMVLKESDKIFVVEENSESSGIGSIISNLITKNGLSVRLKILGLENKQLLEYGEREWLLNNTKLDIDSIATKIMEENFV